MPSALIHRCAVDRQTHKSMYDTFVEEGQALGDTNLGAHELNRTFFPSQPDTKGNIYYEKPDGTRFVANFIAEIGSEAQGIWIAAYPLIATTLVSNKREAQKGESFEITDWIIRAEGDETATDKMILLARLDHTYEVPHSTTTPARTPRRRITKVGSSPNPATTSNDVADVNMETTQVAERKAGDRYSPDLLPDHQGPYFAHKKAKLVQRDYRDVDGTLIAPHEL
ncbi:hypothetical protein DFH08DRAFT_973764 [Mycena albidolilacea]|uniref:Uncharacterized protein n=1 Tax=Mycena albidolilacea TaxID=1033008 RepID=A0AAD7ECJ1_9AGAR|nr:hypothetical protein DFH08DRAFT_973764 [Mycena albidolilacea]